MPRRPELAFHARTVSDSPATGRSLGGSLVVVALLVTGLLVASYPATVVSALVLGGPVIATAFSVRHGVALVRRRRQTGRAKEVCVPAVNVCIEA